MQWLSPTLLAIQVITSLAIIVLVLLQQGKGADMGASFGGGSAGSVFGATGAANFLSRATKWVAIVFFISTGALAYISHHPGSSILEGGIMQGFKEAPARAPASPKTPLAPVGPAVPSVPGNASTPAPAPSSSSSPAPSTSKAATPAPAIPSSTSNSVPAAPASTAVPSAPAAAADTNQKQSSTHNSPAAPASGAPASSK
jgi:preprotein translocase subunit SecG